MRSDSHARVVLVPRGDDAAPPRAPAVDDRVARKAAAELALIREQLAALLDEAPGTRRTLCHLAFVEKAVSRQGLRALQTLPLEVMQRALDQFEQLVSNWSRVGLAALRSKMAVAVIERASIRGEQASEPMLTTIPLELGDDEQDVDAALEVIYAAMGGAPPSAGAATGPAPQGAATAVAVAASGKGSSAGRSSGAPGALASAELVS